MAIPKPIICAINGASVGVSLVISLFCDIRYASSNAKFSAAFAKRGLVAEHGIAWLLPRLIGLNRAFELLASGRTFDAQEADRIGLVNAVFPEETFRQDVAKAAANLALTVSPRSLRIIKRQIYKGTHSTLAQSAHLAEVELQGCLESEDFREGVTHFIEKRLPQFTGR
jgi:enoyl-CoA hydratase/carnithine racemase